MGGDEVGCSLAHRAAAGHLDLDIVGMIDERPPVAPDAPAWLGGLEGLQAIVAEHDVDRVIIAFTDGEHQGRPPRTPAACWPATGCCRG